MSTMSIEETEAFASETCKNLAAMCAVISSGTEKKYRIIENILKHNYCLNHPIPETEYFKLKKPEFIGNTILHLAFKQREHGTFNFLINQGANFTLKNREGETVVHQAFRKSNTNSKECDKLWGKLSHPYIESVLCAHVEASNSSNPSNKNGLTHFHIACMVNHAKAVEFFLKNGVSVGKPVNFDATSLPGFSPLHFAARYCAYEVARILLQHGADVHVQDANGASPLHLLIHRKIEIADWLNTGRRTRHEAFEKELDTNERIMASFLEQVSGSGGSSIVDDKGFTRLHIACTLHDASAAEQLLQLGHEVELAVNDDSPFFPGYTPLHFASHFNANTVRLLLEHGADASRRDARGCTPFDICMKRLNIAGDVHALIASQPSWASAMFSDGKTSLLDFAFAMHRRESLQAFLRGADLDMRLDPRSPLWPGCTPLHLLVLFVVSSNGAWDLYESSDYTDDVSWHDLRMMEAIELCLKLGADVTVQDARSCSPLHLAFRLQKAYLVTVLLRAHKNAENPVDEDGLSHFHIACVAKDSDFVVRLLQTRGVDVNDPLAFSFTLCKEKKTFAFVKGSTPLHIAVITRNFQLAKILLSRGANYVCKDDDSLTPVHRLIGLNGGDDRNLADALLKSSYNLCFMNDSVLPVSRCGLTYLHVASYWNNEAAVEKLLNLGADVNATITYKREANQGSGRWRSRNMQTGPSIDSLTFLDRYTGYTPLRLAMEEKNNQIVKILVRRGADILARYADGMAPVYDIFKSKYSSAEMVNLFIEALSCNVTLQNRMLEDSGLTMLHVACATTDVHLIRNLCSEGLNVNARAHMDSPIWPGCTPLHVLMIKSKDDIDNIIKIIQLLFDYGADVTLSNADQNTPLHEDFERFFVQGPRFSNLLLQAQKDFSINPVSIKGFSHFHIACACKEVPAVEGFLKHGADINLPINSFCEFYGGLTPLHLASAHHLKDVFIFLGKRRIDVEHAIHYIMQIQEDPFYVASIDDYQRTVDILLQHGANPNTRDRSGNTSVHAAVVSKIQQLNILKSLMWAGADLNVENLLDETPLEILLSSEGIASKALVEFFLRHGGKINIYKPANQEGFIPRIFLQSHQANDVIQKCLCEAVINVPDVNYFDEMGRSLIHNVVSHTTETFNIQDYVKFSEDFGKIGHDVDHADKNGRTPLHVAIEFQNLKAVLGLLDCGADINVLRRDDKAVLILNEELLKNVPSSIENTSLLKNVSMHIYKLKLCGIYVNSVNQELDTRIRQDFSFNFVEFEITCAYEISLLKTTKIEQYPITLYDFLSETGIVAAYPMLPRIQRCAVNDFFQNNDAQLRKRFPQLFGVVRLQYRKALARVDLLEPAKIALSILIELEFPDLCSEAVVRFLTNDDLKNLTASADT